MSLDNECGSGAGCLYKEALIESLSAERDSLRAVNAELLEALAFYADPGDYKAPFTGGMGSLYFDCGEKARAAIAGARKLKG